MKPIYLDNAASTPVKSEVLAKFVEVAETAYANPSSMHSAGIEARNVIWDTQDILSEKLGCSSDEIFFTTGATMSNNLLIQGVMRKQPETMFVTSNVEHNDIMELYDWLPYSKAMIGVDKNGVIDLGVLEATLITCEMNNRPFLVSIQMANSETGIIQPIKQIGEIVHKYGGYLHTDATQYIPYYPIDVHYFGIDALSMSGQKIGGIKGSGILYANESCQKHMKPIIFGEQGVIGGTPATPLIASLGKAFELLEYGNEDMELKRDTLLNILTCSLGGILVGTPNNRLPNNIYIRFPGVNGLTLLNLLNDQGIQIGTGSACSTDSDRPSHVAMAYGLSAKEAFECVRFTLSENTSYKEIFEVGNVLKGILKLLKEE